MLFELLVLVFLVVTVLAYVNKEKWLAGQAFLLTIAAFVLYLQHARVTKKKPSVERFSEPLTNSPEIANKLMDLLRNPSTTTPSTTTNTTTSVPSPEPTSTVPKEIALIYPLGLTMYFNSFLATSTNSVRTQRVWKNMVPPLPGCSDESSTHLTFDSVPGTYNRGFYLRENKLTGPPSHMLGINGQTSFSMFFTLKFETFTNTSDKPMDLFRIYANTETINGLSMTIEDTMTNVGANYTLNMRIQYGSKNKCLACVGGQNCESFDTDVVQGEEFVIPGVILNTNNIYTFVLIKDFDHIKLVMSYNNMSIHEVLVDKHLSIQEDVAFSNKEFKLNPHGNVNAITYFVGFMDRALNEGAVSMLRTHIRDYLNILDPDITSRVEEIAELEKQLQTYQVCPYDSVTCQSCPQIQDWGKPNAIEVADNTCLSAIAQYCTTHKTDDGCQCWDPNNQRYNTSGCESVRRAYDTQNYINKNTLTPADLDFIRSNYSLCPKPVESETLPTETVVYNPYQKSTSTSLSLSTASKLINPSQYLQTNAEPLDLDGDGIQDTVTQKKETGFWGWLLGF